MARDQIDGSDHSWFRPPTVFLAIGEGLGIVACVVAAIIYRQNHSRMALWLAFCFGVGTVLNLGLLMIGRVRAARAATSLTDALGEATGRTIPVRDPNIWTARPTPEGGWRWTGGASVPYWFGRLNASSPLAVREWDPRGLKLRVRLGRLFGALPLEVTPSADILCFPVRGLLGRYGVAVRPPGQRPWYFWTGSISEILSTLAWAGYRVSWEERKPQWW